MNLKKLLKFLSFFSFFSVAAFVAVLVYTTIIFNDNLEEINSQINNTISINNNFLNISEIPEIEEYKNNEKREIPTHILEDFMKQFPHIAVYYSNIYNDFTFTHNPNRVYFAASLTKAPYAMYIFQKADNGEINLSEEHPFLREYFAGGSGIIQDKYSFGHMFSQRQLLGYNIYFSDNIALRMLRSIHGLDGFIEFVQSLGINGDNVHNITYSRTTAVDSGILTRAMYDYINSNEQHSKEFLNHLLNNHYGFIRSDYPIASKTGWFDGFGGAWHEMAIVYAPSPYILVLLSNNYGGEDTEIFNKIADFIEEFNRNNF
ncbi:MAG: class A beta-lactamase-related serine hydrolase [Defluviitaleaceae bacterium]|nr:class A beta-lactamase-related serine hydrolase [Defluviitaleaceae bacterium]